MISFNRSRLPNFLPENTGSFPVNAVTGQAKIAGIKDIPVYIRQANDQQLLELALLENLQREDLNAMEIALSYKRMMDELNYTQEQVSERMGKERSTVANYVRLLKLPPDIQVALRNNHHIHGPCPCIDQCGYGGQTTLSFQ